ncbi:RtcB family protein [Flavitalea sp.]|nr:RtcB family protein [Flavitalea sp.]
MEQLNITPTTLLELGFSSSPAIPLIIGTVGSFYQPGEQATAMIHLKALLAAPGEFLNDPVWKKCAEALMPKADEIISLKSASPYNVYGSMQIEAGALRQMDFAVQLPIAVAGALMPDAHQGYGLPIGGVLATRNAVIPYGVGVDIGCRMCLSIYDIPGNHLETNLAQYKRELIANTKFGAGAGYHGQYKADHAIMEDPAFKATPLTRNLKDKAYSQLGSSGGGNHFVEFGMIEMMAADNEFGLPPGNYLALLSHSGSRGFGAVTANHYSKLARSICKLPKEAANLAYFGLDSSEGQEYWMAMNLAGNYASACHEVIHQKLTVAIGGQLLARVENHHNFAWKEKVNGEELIVHRKGATPAGKCVLGIIPGSMTAPGFLVRGKGNEASLNSASHGAGRRMSRTMANNSITNDMLREQLKTHGVTLIGGGTDEAPTAYKDIHAVMLAQSELVDVMAKFSPKLVRMAEDGSRED